AVAAVTAARRAERPRDLDARGLVRAGRAPHRGSRRGASRSSHGGPARSLGALGAGGTGRRGRRGPARRLLAPEPRPHGAVASAAAERLRRAAHQLPRAAGRRAPRGPRWSPTAARAVELRASA